MFSLGVECYEDIGDWEYEWYIWEEAGICGVGGDFF